MNLPRVSWGWATAIVVAILVVGGLSVSLIRAPDTNLSAYHEGGQDLVAFREEVEAQGYVVAAIAASPLSIRDAVVPEETVLVVAGVEQPYRESEMDAIVDFVHAGGRLVLADDSGNGNLLAQRFGVTIHGLRIYAPSGPLVRANMTLPSTGDTYNGVALNVPTHLEPGNGTNGEVLGILDAEDAFIDLDGDGVPGPADTTEVDGFILGYALEAGEGRVVVLSDPEVFSTPMLDQTGAGNREFLVDLLVSELDLTTGTVLLDESRHGAPAGEGLVARTLGAGLAATRDPWLAAATTVAVLLGGLALVAAVPSEGAFGHHTSRLDRTTDVKVDTPHIRVVRAVRARIRAAHGARPEDDVAALSRDPVLADVAGAENGISPSRDLRDIVQRVQDYSGPRSGDQKRGM